MGERRIDAGLANFLHAYRFHGAPYPTTLDLIRYLKAQTPPRFAYLYDELFKQITLFDPRPLNATATKLPNGTWLVKLTARVKRYEADAKGQEHQVPVNDWFYVGVQDANGRYLYLHNRHVVRSKATFTAIVNRKPARAGIDPLDMLIDLNPDGNVIPVTAGR